MQTLLMIAIGINIVTFAAFGIDKYYAIRHKRRVREKSLLGLALIGGSIGAISAMRIFRHKTQTFKTVMRVIVTVQMGIGWIIFAYK